ncbi:DNA polymerase III subunit beta [Puniceicoccus vermicola]|uniref:Beta sliding clamp n=1 Tax=Puniceicoccus vermicola TaxID=388746 RepID=A0A7X1AX12_9BACT|nr:DNA polymerase III subunit beta [Puniceicoccus vermicola]MBC2601412.1 DNA polymerase III subunit beta [Puniceicoccus vermicola]
MKFKVNRDHFSNGLNQVLNVVSTRPTMPILRNVLVEASNGVVTFKTTNLDLAIRCSIKAEVEEEGGLTLPVRKLSSIVRELPNLEVFVETDSKPSAKIKSGGSKYQIVGIAADEFPPLPTFDDQHEFTLPQEDVSSMLRSVSYAQSTDETRYILNGVFFNFADDKLTMVATDGRRLAMVGFDVPVDDGQAGHLILPAKTVAELERLLGQGDSVKISFNDRQVAFEVELSDSSKESGLVENLYLVSKTVEGRYPDYQQVIPKETEHRVRIERELLQECVHRAALVISEKSNSVKLKISENLLEISGRSAEYGESHESMAIKYDGPEVQIAFNPQFLLDPLKAVHQDEVYLEFKDELSPGVFKTLENFLCVVMPLRLN